MAPKKTREQREPRYATIAETMEYAKIGKNTALRWISSGKITAYKQGRIVRIDLNTVDDCLVQVRSAGDA